MNICKLLISVSMLVCVLLVACAPATTPTALPPTVASPIVVSTDQATTPVLTPTLQPYGQEVIEITSFEEPRGMINGFDSLWVNIYADTLFRIDPVNGETLAVIQDKIGREPAAMAVTDDALWVINASSRSISRVDPNANQVTDRIEFPDICCALAVYDDGVYTIDFNKTLSRIDAKTKKVNAFTIQDGQLTDGPFVDDNGIWVQVDGKMLLFFDPATGNFGQTFQPEGAPIGFANGLFFTVTDQSVMGFDPETGDKKVSINTDGQQIAKFGFTSAMLDFHQLGQFDGKNLWIIGQDPSSLYLLIKIDLSAQKILQTIHVGQSPGGFISMVVDGNTIWLNDTHNQVLKIQP